MKTAIVLVLLAPLFAGCLGQAGAGDCHGFTTPAATAGSSYLYDAEGRPRTIQHESIAAYDPDVPTPNRSVPNSLILPAGSQLQLTIAQDPSIRLNQFAQERLAYQASIQADPIDQPAIDFADEWIDAELGNPIQIATRNIDVTPQGILHFIIFDHDDAPGLFYGSLFWGRPMRLGATDSLELTWPGWHQPSKGTLEWAVTRIYLDGGVCAADVQITGKDYVNTSFYFPTKPVELTFHEGVALPVHFQNYQHDKNPRLRLDMIGMQAGEGPPLPAFTVPSDAPRSGTQVPGAAVVPGQIDWFETQFTTARREAEANAEVSAWLDLHPQARVTQTLHREGHPDSRVRDSWQIQTRYADGTDTILVEVQNRSQGVPVVQPEDYNTFIVNIDANENEERIPSGLDDPWLSVEFMRRISMTHFGKLPEVLICPFGADKIVSCSIGSHNGTNRPLAGVSGAALIHPGLSFDVHTGRLINESSLDPDALGTPVPHPNLS